MMAPALTEWNPQRWPVAPDWQPVISGFLRTQAAQNLGDFIGARLAGGAVIYPPQPFRALELTPLSAVKVVILGQDPYHGPGQAEGLAFSVAAGNKLPPSLRNIFKELARESQCGAQALPSSGSLLHWARQGVLLLNACLTVEQGSPSSHSMQGWEALTDSVIKAVLGNRRPVVFMLWGAHAQKLGERMQRDPAFSPVRGDQGHHLVLVSNHPSPLSALRLPEPFIGSGHFSRANVFLRQRTELPVQWWA